MEQGLDGGGASLSELFPVFGSGLGHKPGTGDTPGADLAGRVLHGGPDAAGTGEGGLHGDVEV